MTDCVKYPRTLHLPWSKGCANDDKVMSSTEHLEGKTVVVTEKMDGENTTLYRDHIHARSVDGRPHESRDWVKSFWSTFNWKLPKGVRVCGENLYAHHSIKYDSLKSYFYGFSVWKGEMCADWSETKRVFSDLEITAVPTLWIGKYDEKVLKEISESMDETVQEGYVVRPMRRFNLDQFSDVVGKYVRPNHVKTDEHWMHGEIKRNGLR